MDATSLLMQIVAVIRRSGSAWPSADANALCGAQRRGNGYLPANLCHFLST